MNPWLALGLAAIGLFCSYYFTFLENTYMALTQSKLKELLEKDPVRGAYLEKNYKNLDHIFSTTLFLDYFANIMVTLFLALFFKHFFPRWGVIITLPVATFLVLSFGEIFPKSVGVQRYEKSLLKDARRIYVLQKILRPFTMFIGFFSSIFINMAGGDKNFREPLITEDVLKQAVSLGHEEGIIDKSEMGFIENVMGFRDAYAKDIMTPRTDIIAVDVNMNYDDLIRLIEEEGFSRMPVYENDLDTILGILHVKDLFTYAKDPDNLNLREMVRPGFFTFEYKPVSTLFEEMRAKKMSVAIVLDEYGGTEGLISVEDLIEKLVGSINDEYDEEDEDEIVPLGNHEYLVNGSTNLSEINHGLNLELESEEFDSIGGYLIEFLDRFPEEGEIIENEGLTFIVKETAKNRVEKIVLRLPERNEL